MGGQEVHTGVWSENLKHRHHLEYLGTDEEDNIKLDLKKMDGRMWTTFTRLKIGTRGRLLWTH
jgi:hypothetical protein